MTELKDAKSIIHHIIHYEYFLKDTAKEIYNNYNDLIANQFLKECLENPTTKLYWSSDLLDAINDHLKN